MIIQTNELCPAGYGMFLYSPNILVQFLKAEKCKTKKICSYFQKHKDVFRKAIENGIILPIYPISAYNYTIFVFINESKIVVPDGWEQVCQYDDFYVQVGNSNKLCWASFDFCEYSKESIDKRPTTDFQIVPHGASMVMLPVYGAVDVDIPQGHYRYDLVGYKRIEPLDETKPENSDRNYAYGFIFKSTNTTENDNFDKDSDKVGYDIEKHCTK